MRRAELWAKIWIPLSLVAVSIGLGWIGFYGHYKELGEPITVWNALFFAAGLPIQETAAIDADPETIPLSLQAGRFVGIFVLPYAFVLAFIALFGHLMRPLRIRSWGWPAGRSGRGHAVVCGLGWRGSELVRDLVEAGRRVAVIEADPGNGMAPTATEQGAVVLDGDATQTPALRRAGVPRASSVFVVCDSDETNVRVVKQIVSLLRAEGPRGHTVHCSVEVRDPRTREFVHSTVAGESALVLESFDTFEVTARRLLDVEPVDPFRDRPSREDAHVVILGFSPMARAILRQAVLLGHYPEGHGMAISVFSEGSAGDRERFLSRYPCFRPHVFGVESARRLQRQVLPKCRFHELPDSDTLLLDEGSPLLRTVAPATATTFFVCLDSGLRSSAYAAALAPALARAAADAEADVRVCYYYNYPGDEQRDLVERRLRDLAPGLPVRSFADFLEGCSVDRIRGRPTDDMAREIARFYQLEFGGEDWAGLSEADRTSNRRAADHVAVKLRGVGADLVGPVAGDPGFAFTPAEVAVLADVEHRRWCAEKLLDGWRPLPRTPEHMERWRREKRQLKAEKLHLDLVPYDELTESDQDKDRAQILAIPAFAAALGRGVRRGAPLPEPELRPA